MTKKGREPRLGPERDPMAELDEELDFHIRQRAEELRAQGLTEDEALHRAEAEFGDLAATRAYCAEEDRRRLRRTRFSVVARSLADELRLAWRGLVRRPRDVVAPMAILAVAVALNVLVFTVVRGVLLSPLPFTHPDRMVVVHEVTKQYGLSRTAYPILDAWRRQARSTETVAASLKTEFIWDADQGAVRIPGASVTAGFFGLLDKPLLLGRGFSDEAHLPDGPRQVILSEGLWRRSFAADPSIVDRTIQLDGQAHPVVGVVRDADAFPDGAELWVPLEPGNAGLMGVAGAKILSTVALLRPGETPATAAEELTRLSKEVPGGAPEAAVLPLNDALRGDVRTPLLLLEGAVLLVLLAACANAGGMLLARGVRRRAELAVRTSVGAGSARLAGGLLLEGVLLGAGAGLAGLTVAAVSLKPALGLVPSDLPRAAAIALDPTVALVAVALAVATGVVTALAPAVSGARTAPGALLREAAPGGGSSTVLRRVLDGFVVAQVALAVLLTAGAGLLLRSFVATVGEDPGFDAHQVTMVDVALPEYRYPDVDARLTFAHDLLRRAADLPGATAVALGSNLPISGSNMTSPLVTDDGANTGGVQVATVSAGYFDVLGIPVLEGQGFGDDDREGGPAVLVVDPGIRTADGATLGLGSRAHSYFSGAWGQDSLRTVVGVVGAVRHDGLRAAPPAAAYEPFFQKGGASTHFSLLVRSDAPPATVAAAARTLLISMDPQVPADRIGSMADRVRKSVAGPRFYTVVLGLFGVLAVVLALAGCHAGLAHRVAARRREIGLRMALGASRTGVRRMVLRRGLALTAVGAVAGLLLAVPSTRLLESQLYGVSATDPLTYAGLLVLLFAAAALASDLPARRAARVDPVETLKEG